MDWLLLCSFVCAVFFFIYAYFQWSFQHWKKNKVPQPDPSFPLGNAMNPLKIKENFCEQLRGYYNTFKPTGAKHLGFYIFASPVYVPMDLDLIKHILIKDFHVFMDRGMYVNEKDDPLSAHLFSLEGQKWKTLRNKLTPVFTSGKIKQMFKTLLDVGSEMDKNLSEISRHGEPLDVKELMSKFTTDVIGSCAFGIDCNSFEDPNSEFRKYGLKAFRQDPKQIIKSLISFCCVPLAKKLRITIIDEGVSAFFLKMVRDTVKFREENNVQRNDFMDILIDLKNGKYDLGSLTVEEIAAQAFLFFIGGFETSSSAMTFCLFELAQNKDIQDRARQEILSVLEKHHGELTYEALNDMKYLANVIDETLRKYPPVPTLIRVCTEKYKVPGTDTILEKGRMVLLPIYAIHRDPDNYPEPEIFNPDRFTEEQKKSRHPCAFLPFGDGPRNCIGIRFGMMQTKVGLSMILKNYKLTLNEKTELPLSIDPFANILSTKQTIWLNADKVS